MASPPFLARQGTSDRALIARWQQRQDVAARELLLARYLPRTRRVAGQYWYREEPLDDLEQVASMGLLKAIDRFDDAHGSALWTFALPVIVGELKRYFRDSCWTVRVPRPIQERALAVQRALGDLRAELGRSPSPREIAARLGIGSEEVLEAMEAGSAYDPRSLDASVSGGDDESSTVGELIGVEDESLKRAEQRAAIRPALLALPQRERMILKLRFEEDLTQSEIAERIGISQMHVSRLLRKAIDSMRETLSNGARLENVA